MEVPFERIPTELLESLIEEFVTREGTEYGSSEVSLMTKVAQVKKQLALGHAVVSFNQDDESFTIQSKIGFGS